MGYNPNATGTPSIARSTAKNAVNNTGFSIAKFLPVRIDVLGMSLINPSIESDIDSFAGLTRTLVPDGNSGEVVTSGLVTDTGLVFSPGSVIYVSKSGGIINVKPSIGVSSFVAGDFVIRLGVLTENESNPLLVDALVNIQFLGQL